MHKRNLLSPLLLRCCNSIQKSACYATTTATENVTPIKMSTQLFESEQTDITMPPLIIMHGLFGSKQNWRGVGKALAAKTKRRIYTIDARNHGESPHTSVHNSAGMTADILEFLQDEKLTKVCLMGHSMGGRTMMHSALKHPNLVDRLIVVDISPIAIPRDFFEMNRVFDAMLNIQVPSTATMAEGRKLVKEQLIKDVESNETVDFVMLNLRKHPETGEFYWACNIKVLHKSIPGFDKFEDHIADLQPFIGKATFICGTHSKFVNPDHWPRIQTYFPEGTIHWLDAGHLVHFDQPQQFIQIVTDFLNE